MRPLRNRRFGDLDPKEIAVIALWNLDYPRKDIVRMTSADMGTVGDILESEEWVIQTAKTIGFPSGMSAPIKEVIKCPHCRAKITSVPCVACSLEGRQ